MGLHNLGTTRRQMVRRDRMGGKELEKRIREAEKNTEDGLGNKMMGLHTHDC